MNFPSFSEFPTPSLANDVFGNVKREPDLFLPVGAAHHIDRHTTNPIPEPLGISQGVLPGRSHDQIIATADHEALVRTKNPAYMHLLDYVQRLKASHDSQMNMLGHYDRLLSQRMGAASQPHQMVQTPMGSSSSTPFHTHPSSTRSTPPPTLAPGSQAAAYASIPIVQPVPHPKDEDYPHIKFWTKSQWQEFSNNAADRGIVKTEAGASKTGNKKLSFLENELGQPLGKDEQDQLSKMFYGLLNDLAIILGEHFPHTWSVAGSRFQNYVVYSMFNKAMVFRLCRGFWKGEEWSVVKFSDWSRNGIPSSVKEQKAAIKRQRQELKSRKNTGPAPGTVVHRLDDDDDDMPPATKKIKTEPAPSEALAKPAPAPEPSHPPSPSPQGGSAVPLAIEAPKPKPKRRKTTLASLAIPPINPEIAVPIAKAPAPSPTNPAPAPPPSNAPPVTDPALPLSETQPAAALAPKRKGPAKPPSESAKTAKNLAASAGHSAPKKIKYLNPTKTLNARNLFLADHIQKHGPVTAEEFKTIFDKAMADVQEKLKWEKLVFSAKEASKQGAKKSTRKATKKAAEPPVAIPEEGVEENEELSQLTDEEELEGGEIQTQAD